MPKPVKKLPIPDKPKRSNGPTLAARKQLDERMSRVQGTPAADQMILDPETVIREHMRKMGAKGGKVSGAKRMEMPKKDRIAIAKKGAAARWNAKARKSKRDKGR